MCYLWPTLCDEYREQTARAAYALRRQLLDAIDHYRPAYLHTVERPPMVDTTVNVVYLHTVREDTREYPAKPDDHVTTGLPRSDYGDMYTAKEREILFERTLQDQLDQVTVDTGFDAEYCRRYAYKLAMGGTVRAKTDDRRKVSSSSHTAKVSQDDLDDIVQSAYILYVQSRTDGRIPLDTRYAARYALRNHMRWLKRQARPHQRDGQDITIRAMDRGMQSARGARGLHYILTGGQYSGRTLMEQRANYVMDVLAAGGTLTLAADLLDVSRQYLSAKIVPLVEAVINV
jgi:hypothetical protein